MRDVVVLLLIMAFFAVGIAYVWWCDRIIGPDPADLTDEDDEPALASVSPDTSSNAVAVTQNGMEGASW